MTHPSTPCPTGPYVPAYDENDDVLSAALRYAAAGLYVLPLDPDSKKPAAELGRHWQHKSSLDGEQVIAWFAGTSYGVGLHVGRSGVVGFDVDHPENLPAELAKAIEEEDPPHQSTRSTVPGRGHYLFRFRAGRVLGNGIGKLGGGWGEVRGRGGQIVAAPTAHPEHADGGRYAWVRTGDIPELPAYVDELLHDASDASDGSGGSGDVATDEEVRAFMAAHTGSSRPELLDGWVTTFANKVAEGESRHQRMLSVAAGAFKEARAGYFPARDAMERLEAVFLDAVQRDPLPGGRQGIKRGPGMATSEWLGISAWAVAEAGTADLAAVRSRVERQMPDGDDLSWIPGWNGRAAGDGGFGRSPVLTGDAAGGRAELRTAPEMFFDPTEGLRAVQLAKAVLAMGPLTCDRAGHLFCYTDGVWRRDAERVVVARAVELLQDRYRMGHDKTVARMLASREPGIDDDTIDTAHLNLPNGLLDWRTGELRAHDPSVPSVIRIPVEWNPQAACPQIESWMRQVFPPDAVGFVEEVIGYTLLFDNPLHKAVMLYGRGRNGKGTFLRLLRSLLGRENVCSVTPQALDENRFRVAELYGKLANLAGDVDPRTFKVTETFKQATGADGMTAERKFGQPFGFVNRATMIAAFNQLPRSSDTTEGFFSRWIVLPFTGYFPPGVADPGLEQRLQDPAELQGLLARAVAGLQRLMRRRGFALPASVEAETAGFRRAADHVRAFLDEWLPGRVVDWEPRSQVYTAYTTWCADNGHQSLSAGNFYQRAETAAADTGHQMTQIKRQGTRGLRFTRLDAQATGA